jgi:phenylpropionate dioxygenase-like ring-hydroxylating dioxygenase large terminal subunit
MFVHENQLRHVLAPSQYFAERPYEIEIERLFLRGWHLVATMRDLPKSGDFLTLELFGKPVLVRNIDGKIHAFLNVCPHRHCLITSRARGSDPRFRCQYHGWEFTREGRTAHIPDARSFRPFDRENARLREFRTELCGEMVLVCLSDDAPPVAEQFGPLYETLRNWFAPPYRQVARWEIGCAANWKVPVENSLEGYHTPMVHPKTFGPYAEEEDCEHVLDPRYTIFRTPVPRRFPNSMQAWAAAQLGIAPENVYTHMALHPHLLFNSLDVHRMAQCVVPTSAATTRIYNWVYGLRGARNDPIRRILAAATGRAAAAIAKRIVYEDSVIIPNVQRGLASSPHPGVIGRREERIYVFQRFVADKTAREDSARAPERR